MLVDNLVLQPVAVVHGEVWQLVTYWFMQMGLRDILFGMLTLWFCGSLLEGARRVLADGAVPHVGDWWAVVASAISFTHLLRLSPESAAAGAWRGSSVMVAIAMRFGNAEFLLSLPFRFARSIW